MAGSTTANDPRLSIRAQWKLHISVTDPISNMLSTSGTNGNPNSDGDAEKTEPLSAKRPASLYLCSMNARSKLCQGVVDPINNRSRASGTNGSPNARRLGAIGSCEDSKSRTCEASSNDQRLSVTYVPYAMIEAGGPRYIQQGYRE
jgi:hypothetical protein